MLFMDKGSGLLQPALVIVFAVPGRRDSTASSGLFAFESDPAICRTCAIIAQSEWMGIMAIAKTKKKSIRAARLDIRLNPKAKEKIEQAAVVSHQTVTDFVVTSLMRASEEALERQQIIRLTNRDRDLFLAALEDDVRPNRALRKAADRFKRFYK